ncbi:MAG: IS1595 family transposase [Planctomycetota bacterium]
MRTQTAHPVAGVDYPRTLQEFNQRFSTEQHCREYLLGLRWPDGFRCPSCSSTKAWKTRAGHLQCSACQRRVSPTAGTIFEGTRKPLRLWFMAMWFVTSQKNGGSALGLKRMLGLGSYQTAWSWLHKLRRAMVRPDRDRLRGRVEVDECFVGGIQEGADGRGTKKAIVVIAIEILHPKGFGRIRLGHVPNATSASLVRFVKASVEPGSVVHTDGWSGYRPLEDQGYGREVTNLAKSGEPAHVEMPGVHRIASLLKRWLLGTHQGAVSAKHLSYYLDEFAFRFNRRTSKARGLLFYRLLQQAVQVDPAPLASIVGSPHPQ